MKRILAVILAITLAFSMVAVLSACGKKETTTTATETSATEATTAEETTTAANLPKAGETVKLGTVSVKIPDGWEAKEYTEGEKVEIQPTGSSMKSVEVSVHKVFGDDHAKEWADNINGNYGGNKEIDEVEIGGKTFYRVKADTEQNICFADIDDQNYVKVSVMFMPWDDGDAVLSTIAFD